MMSSFLTIATRGGHQVSFTIYASILLLKPMCWAVTFQAGIWIHINHRRDHKLTRRIIFPIEVVIVVEVVPIVHALGKTISIFIPWLPLVSSLALTIIVIILSIIKLSTTIIASPTVIVIILSLVIRLESSLWFFLQLFKGSFLLL